MAYQKLGRDSSARKALFRDLVTDLFIQERIQTTEAKAKELRPIAEKLITLAKRGDLAARRQVAVFGACYPLFRASRRIYPHFEAGTSSRGCSAYGLYRACRSCVNDGWERVDRIVRFW
jgi:hypothetical protein